MKTINQSKTAQLLNMKRSSFHRLLSGERNMKWPAAKKFAAKIGSKPELWINQGGTPAERMAAIMKYVGKPSHF